MIQKNNNVRLNSKKQNGATLFASLMFLVVMTTVGVSSAKIAFLDTLVASNDHKQMQNYQQTANELKELTSVEKLYVPLVDADQTFNPDTGVYFVPNTRSGVTESITDLKTNYPCKGSGGLALSLGPDVSRCFGYEFNAKAAVENTGVRDRHVRGAGKEKPSVGKNSYLNN